MKLAALDSSVLVAALRETEPSHEACASLLRRRGLVVWAHALAETFSTLSGESGARRFSPRVASQAIELSVLPRVRRLALDDTDYLTALDAAHGAGVRGGAIYDFLHLRAARKAGAQVFYTLNLADFRALARPGDPQILLPEVPSK